MPFSVIKITRTLLAREDHFLELHNVQHGEKDPVDGGTPTLMEVPVVPMRDRVSGFKQGLEDLIQDCPLPLTVFQ